MDRRTSALVIAAGALAAASIVACGAFTGSDSGSGSNEADASASKSDAAADGSSATGPDGAPAPDAGGMAESDAAPFGPDASLDAAAQPTCAPISGSPASYCPYDGKCYLACALCKGFKYECYDCSKGAPTQGSCVPSPNAVLCPGLDSCGCTTVKNCYGPSQVCFGGHCADCDESGSIGLACQSGGMCHAGGACL